MEAACTVCDRRDPTYQDLALCDEHHTKAQRLRAKFNIDTMAAARAMVKVARSKAARGGRPNAGNKVIPGAVN